ncbi:MAG: putative DNA-binding domain-containing protein [Proteobacteria bacterium]|nr:putative DNA-binding domain-containing protein [Pseudomonadota bacterium]
MSSLKDTQKDFQFYLFERNEDIFSRITGPDEDFIQTRLDVYAEGYLIRLTEILRMNYPCLQRCLGEETFVEMCEAYIDAYPSTNFSVRHFGEYLSEFLIDQSFGKENLALAELAKFEFTLVSVVTASDAKTKRLADLAQIPEADWAYLKFKFHPSLKMETFNFNVADYVQNFLDQELCSELQKLKEQQSVIFWRDGLQTARFSILTEAQKFIFQSCLEDKNFSEICEGLSEFLPIEKVAEYSMNQLVWMLNNSLLSYCEASQ